MTFVRILMISFTLMVAQIATAAQPTVLVMGDSLSAGYGFNVEKGWVNLLEKKLSKTSPVMMINASVTGETTSGGLNRLPALLKKHNPQIVILELGGNDGLRGQSVKIMQDNLQNMINLSKKAGAKVLLVGMQIPTNYGQRYTSQFKSVYPALATKNNISLVPFLLENVATHSDLIQQDGIHPNAAAQPLILNNVQPLLEAML